MPVSLNLVVKMIKYALIIFVLMFLAISTIASMVSTPVSKEKQEEFAATNFYGDADSDGPDRITLIETNDDAFGVRLAMLQSAEQTLDIVYHTIADGETTAAFFNEVLKAADRGVQVRLITDGKFGLENAWVKRVWQAVSLHENITCRMYNPLKILQPWSLHSIFHDKFIIVDEQYALIGGRNIDDRFYSPKSFTGAEVYDRDVLVWNSLNSTDSVVYQLSDYMQLLWDYEYMQDFKAKDPGEKTYQLLIDSTASLAAENPQYFSKTLDDYLAASVATRKISLIHNPINNSKKEPWVAYQVWQLAMSAENSIWIHTPYATANKDLISAMNEAGQVEEAVFLTNSIGSSPNFPAFSNYYFQREKFLDTGFAVYEYQKDISLHGKSVLIDDQLSIVGSLNMDDRSFYLDTESMLVVDSSEFADILKAAMQNYVDDSLLVAADNNYAASEDEDVVELKAPWYKKAVMWLVSLFSRPFQSLI